MFINDSIDAVSEDVDVQMPSRLPTGKLDACVRDARRLVEATRHNHVREHSGVDVKSYRQSYSAIDGSASASCEVLFDTLDLSVERRSGPPNLHAVVLSFPARLLIYVREKCNGTAPVAYKRAGISRQIYSRIVSDDGSTVDKRTAMRFCIGLQLEMNEAELLMKAAGFTFSATLPEDEVFAYCINNKIWNIEDINDIMVRSGLKSIL
jgi:hypothetical protein